MFEKIFKGVLQSIELKKMKESKLCQKPSVMGLRRKIAYLIFLSDPILPCDNLEPSRNNEPLRALILKHFNLQYLKFYIAYNMPKES